MITKAFTTVGFAVLVLAFCSCHKGDTGTNRIQGDSTLLVSNPWLITNWTVPEDTMGKRSFYYDDNKRIRQTRLDGAYGNSFSNVNYYYQGAGNLPYLSVRYTGEFSPLADTTSGDSCYYFFQNNKLVSDSMIRYNQHTSPVGFWDKYGFNSHRYVYSGTTVNADVNHYLGPYFGQIKMTDIISVTQSGANAVVIERKETQNGITRTQRYRISYDNNPNPFYKITLQTPAFGLLTDFNFRPYFPNNITEIEKIFDDTYNPPAWHEKFIYTYRSDGYPLTLVYYDLVLNPAVSYRKEFFFYQH